MEASHLWPPQLPQGSRLFGYKLNKIAWSKTAQSVSGAQRMVNHRDSACWSIVTHAPSLVYPSFGCQIFYILSDVPSEDMMVTPQRAIAASHLVRVASFSQWKCHQKVRHVKVVYDTFNTPNKPGARAGCWLSQGTKFQWWTWWVCLWPWWSWQFHRHTLIPEFIELYTLNMYSF